MLHLSKFLLITSVALFLMGCGSIGHDLAEPARAAQSVPAPGSLPGDCPVTRPPETPFVPPEPYPASPPYEAEFWYGTAELWTLLPEEGIWRELPRHDGLYTQKVFWWREGYNWRAEPEPALTVTGRRLDAAAPPLVAAKSTNGFHEDLQSFMLAGVGLPTSGCWQITGRLDQAELTVVVWVAD